MLFANSNFEDLLVKGALFNSGIEIQCVSEHVWVGRGGLRGRGGELPAGGIRASQGTFSSFITHTLPQASQTLMIYVTVSIVNQLVMRMPEK